MARRRRNKIRRRREEAERRRNKIRRREEAESAAAEEEEIKILYAHLKAKFGCGYVSSKKKHILRHHRVHSDEREFACPIEGCDSRFKDFQSCRNHIRTHTGEKPHECKECGMRFAQPGSLPRHMKNKHCDDKPFVCGKNGCSYRCKDKYSLKLHKRRHNGEKPYPCKHLGRGERFAYVGSLLSHKTSKRFVKITQYFI
jgi:hypothetical protein